ncbi:MAG: UDP-3-O-(3-hydroxymyristoyl)glucosamine N-acyltransferase [Flavobacteriales bacterium]
MASVNIPIADILHLLGQPQLIGKSDTFVNKLVELNGENDDPHALFWCSKKNEFKLKNVATGVIIVAADCDLTNVNQECIFILVDKPRHAFKMILEAYFLPKKKEPSISPKASIDPSVVLGSDATVGHFTVIEEKCIIGDNVTIGNNTVILANTIIENGVSIGSNCTIGGVGFGYEKNEEGNFELIPHIGNVHLCENVEIGNNTCIDRAVLGSTKLERNVKVDNLVHIAHGVHIGANSLIIANSLVAGSCKIGKNVWVAPNAVIKNGVHVGDDAVIGLAAVVLKNVNKGEVIIGNPGKPLIKSGS